MVPHPRAKFASPQPQQRATSATVPSLLVAKADRPRTAAGGGPGAGHSLHHKVVDPGEQHRCF